MFAKGSNKIENLDDRGPYSRPNPKVVIDTYDAKFEDFSSSVDPSATDSWVFDKVEEFFDYALEGEDQELRLKLRDDKIILFLHYRSIQPMLVQDISRGNKILITF